LAEFFTTSSTEGAPQRGALCGIDAISLSLNKEMAKESQPKGRMPFGNPQREKSFRYRSTHFFAKGYIFSFCVCKLKKLANTKVARKRNSKSLRYLRRTLRKLIFKQKRFLLRLPRVVAIWREILSVGREPCGRASARCSRSASKQCSCVSAQAEM